MVPIAILRPCPVPGCPALVANGRCPAHQRDFEHQRGSAKERGYSASWRRLRRAVLAIEPLCRHCAKQGYVTAASELDHVAPMSQGGARLDPANVQPLCGLCHRKKTQQDQRRGKGG